MWEYFFPEEEQDSQRRQVSWRRLGFEIVFFFFLGGVGGGGEETALLENKGSLIVDLIHNSQDYRGERIYY